MSGTIVVTGDIVRQNCLAHLPQAPDVPLPGDVLLSRDSGACYLSELVTGLFKECGGVVEAPSLDATEQWPAGVASKEYLAWSPFERVIGGVGRVWRVAEVIGFLPSSEAPSHERSGVQETECDLLVIDDCNRGFRNNKEVWSDAVERIADSSQVVLKSGEPFGKGSLSAELFSKYSERLTVVLPVTALRARGAPISQGLSWDRTLEDLNKEMKSGVSSTDLARAKLVFVYFKGAGIAVYREGNLDRLVYYPGDLEGTWHQKRPGMTFGDLSIITAAVTRHLSGPTSYPLFFALSTALEAVRLNHETGCGLAPGPEKNTQDKSALYRALQNFQESVSGKPEEVIKTLRHGKNSDDVYHQGSKCRSTIPTAYKESLSTGSLSVSRMDLLQDSTGHGFEFVAAKAMQIVIHGENAPLDGTPILRFGSFVTADREEIERINEICKLMLSYCDDSRDSKPLSIAVFGPPGAGKSSAIRQLANEMLLGKQSVLEFNLSQMESREELHRAFHQVRDASVRGSIPLVFWDEFDVAELKWIKEFLGPMQDAKFAEAGIEHPFGKAIFIFAGGTCHSFQAFDRTITGGEEARQFALAKGPDFMSRLRGYINIKGPNRIPGYASDSTDAGLELDVAHLIRRAIMLRGFLERYYPFLLDENSGKAMISPSVARGFLRVKRYYHGTRSMRSLITMSSISKSTGFNVSSLPSQEFLLLHVSPDFIEQVNIGELESATVESLSRSVHNAWLEEKQSAGWSFGQIRDDSIKKHPLMVAYDELNKQDLERNRATARLTIAKLKSVGLKVVPKYAIGPSAIVREEFTDGEIESLMRLEHDIWIRDHLIKGFDYSNKTDESLRLHRCIALFDDLSDEDKAIDRAIAIDIPKSIEGAGSVLVQEEENEEN